MGNPSTTLRGAGLLVGEAIEDWTDDAVFATYSAFNEYSAPPELIPVPNAGPHPSLCSLDIPCSLDIRFVPTDD